jgi:carotenoid cleavage dioxygenase-like enzyme
MVPLATFNGGGVQAGANRGDGHVQATRLNGSDTDSTGRAGSRLGRPPGLEPVPHDKVNPFLEGPFAPVEREAIETSLRFTGVIPRALNGLYACIGPNPMQVPNPAIHHWFLGDGMVHGVRLRNGRALRYRNRWIGTDSVNRRLGWPPPAGPRHRDLGTVNTNIIGHAGRIWALVEGGALPVQLDAGLQTVQHGFFGTSRRRSFPAHPRRDLATGSCTPSATT